MNVVLKNVIGQAFRLIFNLQKDVGVIWDKKSWVLSVNIVIWIIKVLLCLHINSTKLKVHGECVFEALLKL